MSRAEHRKDGKIVVEIEYRVDPTVRLIDHEFRCLILYRVADRFAGELRPAALDANGIYALHKLTVRGFECCLRSHGLADKMRTSPHISFIADFGNIRIMASWCEDPHARRLERHSFRLR